ncbi:phage tail protein [Fibrobacter sp.]|uniref:phage tail protein n=1 Tax=Fibrobacter sp. TaxID=35828 RepID=UPI0038695A4D
MNTYSTKEGETWDSIAYDLFDDSFAMDTLLEANDYEYYDTVTFSDGDVIQIPQQAIMESAIIPNPWDATTVIDNPWGRL